MVGIVFKKTPCILNERKRPQKSTGTASNSILNETRLIWPGAKKTRLKRMVSKKKCTKRDQKQALLGFPNEIKNSG
jgi:hypothetical protein